MFGTYSIIVSKPQTFLSKPYDAFVSKPLTSLSGTYPVFVTKPHRLLFWNVTCFLSMPYTALFETSFVYSKWIQAYLSGTYPAVLNTTRVSLYYNARILLNSTYWVKYTLSTTPSPRVVCYEVWGRTPCSERAIVRQCIYGNYHYRYTYISSTARVG